MCRHPHPSQGRQLAGCLHAIQLLAAALSLPCSCVPVCVILGNGARVVIPVVSSAPQQQLWAFRTGSQAGSHTRLDRAEGCAGGRGALLLAEGVIFSAPTLPRELALGCGKEQEHSSASTATTTTVIGGK